MFLHIKLQLILIVLSGDIGLAIFAFWPKKFCAHDCGGVCCSNDLIFLGIISFKVILN